MKYGDLNPIRKSRVKRKNNPREFNSLDYQSIVREAAYKTIFDSNALENIGPFNAIVLQPPKSGRPLGSAFNFIDKGVGGDSAGKTSFYVRARIPELHAHIPDPIIAQSEIERENLIALHPFFVSVSISEGDMPAVGDIILVDFQDKNNMTDGIFLSRVSSGPGQSIGAVAPPLAAFPDKFFNEARPRLNVLEPDGNPIGNLSDIQSQVAVSKEIDENRADLIATGISSTSNLGGTNEFPVERLPGVKENIEKGIINKLHLYYLERTSILLTIAQEFWRDVFSDSKILVTSCFRPASILSGFEKSVHGTGVAVDVTVRTKEARRYPKAKNNLLPVHIVWVGYRYMIEKGTIPPGGLGLYLNVKGWDKDKPFTTENSSKYTTKLFGAGSSGNVHYDFRGSKEYDTEGIPTGKGKNVRDTPSDFIPWVFLDFEGEGSSSFHAYRGNSQSSILKKEYPQIHELIFGDGWKKYAREMGLRDV